MVEIKSAQLSHNLKVEQDRPNVLSHFTFCFSWVSPKPQTSATDVNWPA